MAATAATPEQGAEGAGLQLRVSPRPVVGSGAHPLTAAVLDLLLDVVLLAPEVQPGPAVPPADPLTPIILGGAKAPPSPWSSTRLGAFTQPPPSSAFSSPASLPLPSADSVSAERGWLCPMLGAALARAHASDPEVASPYPREALSQGLDLTWWVGGLSPGCVVGEGLVKHSPRALTRPEVFGGWGMR